METGGRDIRLGSSAARRLGRPGTVSCRSVQHCAGQFDTEPVSSTPSQSVQHRASQFSTASSRSSPHPVAPALSRFEPGTKTPPSVCESHGMQFSPAIDARLVASVPRIADIHCSAEVWRGLRRRALRLGTTTPCYESVRRLVIAERERRAMLIATIGTTVEIMTRRIPVLPEDVPRIYARRLVEAHSRMRLRSPRPP